MEFILTVWLKCSWWKRTSVAHLSSRFWINDVGRGTGCWLHEPCPKENEFHINSWRLIIFIQLCFCDTFLSLSPHSPEASTLCGLGHQEHLSLRLFARHIQPGFVRWEPEQGTAHSHLIQIVFGSFGNIAEHLNRFDKLLIWISRNWRNSARLYRRHLRCVSCVLRAVCRCDIHE